MSNLFKDIYNVEFYNQLSGVLNQSLAGFNRDKFNHLIFTPAFDNYKLKERMSHTAKVLHQFLTDDFELAVIELKLIINNLNNAGIKEQSVEYMFLPQYIELYGLDDYESSIDAFEFITQFTSCEFAVRPFLLNYPEQMFEQMLRWTQHHNRSVRRLASEGTRPRLPWAMALPGFKQNPQPLRAIFSALYQDPSEVVRRSVANNLNDIAKDNPKFVIAFATEHLGESMQTDKLIKHACRTLLKQGDEEVLTLFGLSSLNLELTDFSIQTPTVAIGEHLAFAFTLNNAEPAKRLIRIEYGLYYLKKNGKLAKKVFKISEREIAQNASYKVDRKQSFKRITTRVFYSGEHQLSIIINGRESQRQSFMLV